MDALWWFYTVVLGAAFAQIAVAIAVQVKTRVAVGVRLHLPTLLWLVFLIVLTIEVWIAVGYYQRSVTSMSVFSLLAFLWVPMGIFILGVFLADQWWNGEAITSDEQRFDRLRVAFFTVLLLIPVVNLVHEFILGSAGMDADLIFPLLLALGAVIGFVIRGRRADTVLAAVMVGVISIYLVTSYGTIAIG